jgi:hypothetical protein
MASPCLKSAQKSGGATLWSILLAAAFLASYVPVIAPQTQSSSVRRRLWRRLVVPQLLRTTSPIGVLSHRSRLPEQHTPAALTSSAGLRTRKSQCSPSVAFVWLPPARASAPVRRPTCRIAYLGCSNLRWLFLLDWQGDLPVWLWSRVKLPLPCRGRGVPNLQHPAT